MCRGTSRFRHERQRPFARHARADEGPGQFGLAAFQSLQLEAIEDPKKLLDRDFFERLTRAEAEFKRLFNAMDRQ
jgi:hypothetical protein